MESTVYSLKLKFLTAILGSQPGRDTPASDFIRGKVKESRPDLDIADEIGTLPEELIKGTTGFHRCDGKPAMLNYHITGMLKEAAEVMNGVGGFKALKSKIDNLVMVGPRVIPINTDKPITICERPLRAMTMQGPRTSLARSEQIQEGAWIQCELKVIKSPKTTLTRELLVELLDYAKEKGFGQWRNSGYYGQFEYELK